MDLWVGRDVEYFARRVRPFLERATERIILARILTGIESGLYPEVILGFGVDADGEAVAAAIRTPPMKLLLAGCAETAEELATAWLAIDPDVPGVSGQPADAQAFAGAWRQLTGARTRQTLAEAMHDLTEVIPPADPPPGQLRQATDADLDLLAEWMLAFTIETGVDNPTGAVRRFKPRLRAGNIYVWECEGRPVAMVGHAPPVRGIANVAPVFTPPELRGQGYATAATAELSAQLLAQGANRCMLFTDLANPISNYIYAKIGYVRFGAWEEHEFLQA